MPWRANQNREQEIVEVRLSGNLSTAEMNQCAERAIALAREAGIRCFLIDAADLETAPNIADILQLPAAVYANLGLDRQSRIAITLPRTQKARAAAQFYETACLNRGWNVKLVADLAGAADWMRGRIPRDIDD